MWGFITYINLYFFIYSTHTVHTHKEEDYSTCKERLRREEEREQNRVKYGNSLILHSRMLYEDMKAYNRIKTAVVSVVCDL